MSCDTNTLLEDSRCFQCLDYNQLMMVKSQLLCEISNHPPVIPPVLSFSFPNLSWEFSGTNPDHWSIQESNNFGTTWEEVGTATGSERSAQFLDSGVLARIVGEDSGNNPIIPPSNSVDVE